MLTLTLRLYIRGGHSRIYSSSHSPLDMSAVLRHIRTLSKTALPAVPSARNSATIQVLKARLQCRMSALHSAESSLRASLLRSYPQLPHLFNENQTSDLRKLAPMRVMIQHKSGYSTHSRRYSSLRSQSAPPSSARHNPKSTISTITKKSRAAQTLG